MTETTHNFFLRRKGHRINVHRWPCADAIQSKANILIAHGMGEHGGRYEALAKELNNHGFNVLAHDQRGHGGSRFGASQSGDMGYDGWNESLADLQFLHHWLEETYAKPTVLLGHSMGAMMAQQYLYRFGASLKGAVLSGSPGHMPALISLAGQAIATIDTWRFDPAAPSPWLSENLFRTNNRPFEKAGNGNGGFAWLSRDEQEVMRYREDPLCGAILNAAGLKGMFDGLKKSTQKANIDCINKQIPILIISGEKDPVHNSGKGIRVLAKRYRQTGLKVTSKIYPGGRHEMFNEINREEVYKDLLQWLSEIGYD